MLTSEKAPITLAQHIGLGHLYAVQHLPPCIHGKVGASYWSLEKECAPMGAPEGQDMPDPPGVPLEPGRGKKDDLAHHGCPTASSV